MHWHSNESNMACSQKRWGHRSRAISGNRALSSARARAKSISEDYGRTELAAKRRAQAWNRPQTGLAPRPPSGQVSFAHALPMDATLTPAVRAEQLTKVYKTATAVDGISFTLPY